MLEKIRGYLDKGLKTGILLTDLSKAFGSISHGLLLAKLHAYGFSKISLNLIYNYLTGRRQRTKIGDSFSQWRSNLFGVPVGSILGPLSLTFLSMISFSSQNTSKLQIMLMIILHRLGLVARQMM